MKLSIHEAAASTMRKSDISHCYHDLYLRTTETSDKIIAEYPHHIITVFTDKINGGEWYEIKNAYDKNVF